MYLIPFVAQAQETLRGPTFVIAMLKISFCILQRAKYFFSPKENVLLSHLRFYLSFGCFIVSAVLTPLVLNGSQRMFDFLRCNVPSLPAENLLLTRFT